MAPSTTFCCCLPLRLGVGLLSLWTALISSFLAGIVWWWWHRLMRPNSVEVPAGVWCAAWGGFALVSLGGFFGTLLPKRLRILVCLYEYALILVCLAKFAATIYAVVRLFQLKSYGVFECDLAPQISSSGAAKTSKCTKWYNEGLLAFTIVFSLFTLIDGYHICLVVRYALELKREARIALFLVHPNLGWIAELQSTAFFLRPEAEFVAPVEEGQGSPLPAMGLVGEAGSAGEEMVHV